MPATPTIAITQPLDEPPRLRITINNGGSSVTNRLWRSTPTENNGAAVLIANTIAQDSKFDDFNIASGLSYSYFVVADDGSTTATSATSSSSVTLRYAILHAVTKNSALANAIATITIGSLPDNVLLETGDTLDLESAGILETEQGTGGDGGYGLAGLAMYDQSHVRQYHVDSTLRLLNNSVGPRIGLSTIEEGSITVPTVIPQRNDGLRAVLRAVYQTRAMLCLRTALGNKWFGRISVFSEQPMAQNFAFNFTFEILDFSESVA